MSTMTRFRAVASPFDLTGLSWLLGPDIKIEERLDGDRYIIRAELPGLDPAKDVQVSLAAGELRLQVERKEEHTEKGHSEFRYGTFYRTIPLPSGAKTDTLTAATSTASSKSVPSSASRARRRRPSRSRSARQRRADRHPRDPAAHRVPHPHQRRV